MIKAGLVSLAVQWAMSEEYIRKEGWYLGEVDQEAATSILIASDVANVFVVYRLQDSNKYMLSARFQSESNLIEHLPISCPEEGKYQISGQAGVYNGLIEVVNSYIKSTTPPLTPALHGKSFETQISLTEAPPDYSNAQRVLKPDIAPLPDIASVEVDVVTEAKEGHVSPSSSMRRQNNYHGGINTFGRIAPSYIQRSHWYRYEDYHCCHPRNVCHCCCYRSTYWNGYSESPTRKWYNPAGSGPLRVIGLLLFWLLCGLCFGCCKLTVLCLQLCCICVFRCLDYDDDD